MDNKTYIINTFFKEIVENRKKLVEIEKKIVKGKTHLIFIFDDPTVGNLEKENSGNNNRNQLSQ